MTQPQQPQRLPIQLGVGVVDTVRPVQIAISISTGQTQFVLVTDMQTAEELPDLLNQLLVQELPKAKAISSGLILPGQSLNGHQPPPGPTQA